MPGGALGLIVGDQRAGGSALQLFRLEATTTVGQRRSESPLLLQAHRLTLASPAAGPGLEHAGERRSAIHATPVVKTPAG